jgi:hypothetical protein
MILHLSHHITYIRLSARAAQGSQARRPVFLHTIATEAVLLHSSSFGDQVRNDQLSRDSKAVELGHT